MKLKFLVISVFLLLFANSCKEGYISVDDCYDYDYNDCITTEYFTSFIYMDFTIDDVNKKVPYTVYEGSVDNGTIIFQDTTTSSEVILEGEFDVPYSVKAEYKKDGKIINVIDGGTAEKWDQNVCDSVCWHYIDIELDLELKY